MALSNAQRQRRRRDNRNEMASVWDGTPKEITEAILSHLGVDKAKKVGRALDKRLRNIKPDYVACGGAGCAPVHFLTACGKPFLGKNALRLRSRSSPI